MNKQLKIEKRIKEVNEMLAYTDNRLKELKKQVRLEGFTSDEVKKQRNTIYELRSLYRREIIDLVDEMFKLEEYK
jgi:hypothetical protein